MLRTIKQLKWPFHVIYLSAFLFGLHMALTLYINSSFLEQFVSESVLGLIYATGAILTLILLGTYPEFLRKMGNLQMTMTALFLEIGLLLTLAYTSSIYLIIMAFIGMQALITLILFNLDVFLESYTKEKETGTVRGIMLTVINVAILLGPLISGIILTNNGYSKMYIIAAILLIPMIIFLARHFKSFKDSKYDRASFMHRIKQVFWAKHPKDGIRHAILSNLLMRFFFVWMILYTPLYLHKYVGFEWSEIGIILTIMLLPLVLFEVPVGKIVDRDASEKKYMALGFGITAFFTASLFFIGENSLFVWAALLFGTRIGMSFVEITTESYFFKHITEKDTNTLGIFRDTRPVAYLIGPLLASAVLIFFSINYLFIILGAIMTLGIWNTLLMK